MAANMASVFFRMAAPVTSGTISGVSVAWQLKKAQTPAIVVEATSTASGGIGGCMPPGTSEEIADWWGGIKSTAPALVTS